jgi:hypothetical protein
MPRTYHRPDNSGEDGRHSPVKMAAILGRACALGDAVYPRDRLSPACADDIVGDEQAALTATDRSGRAGLSASSASVPTRRDSSR